MSGSKIFYKLFPAITILYRKIGPFRFFVAEHLATPFPFIARSTAHKQPRVFFVQTRSTSDYVLSQYKLANLYKTVNTGKLHISQRYDILTLRGKVMVNGLPPFLPNYKICL
jgi:hypothetical protein